MADQDEMDLRTFISSTLTQIVGGVKDAIDEVRSIDPNAKINPTPNDQYYSSPENVEFDVAVTVTKTKKGDAGAGIHIAGIRAGGKGEIGHESEEISRIKFSVPISVPNSPGDQWQQRPLPTHAETEDELI